MPKIFHAVFLLVTTNLCASTSDGLVHGEYLQNMSARRRDNAWVYKIFLKNLFLEKILEKKMTHYSMSHFKLNLFEKIENFYFRIFIRQNHNLA